METGRFSRAPIPATSGPSYHDRRGDASGAFSPPYRNSARRGMHRGVVEIAPVQRWPRIQLRELWSYRELFYFMVWRDLKVRYAQTVLGAAWAIVQPLLTMVVFTIVFGRLAKLPSDGVPYSVFSLAALTPWNYFAAALIAASSSTVSNTNLITKIYFPRLIIPLASVLGGLPNFGITFAILLLMLFAFGIVPSAASIVVLPLLLLILMMTACGIGCWLAALAVQYRDIRNVAGFLIQLWLYACPIVYPLSMVPQFYRPLYILNPMVGVVEGFRSALLGTTALPWTAIAVAGVVSVLLLATGLVYFRRMEQTFADVA